MKRTAWSKPGRGAWSALALVLVAATCGGTSSMWDGEEIDPACRQDPRGCDGTLGALCSVEDDCSDGICCLSRDCGRGMCTYLCGSNGDCPPGTACDGGFCFFTCSRDADCAAGQRCRENDTVCQWD